jgi:periplasmic protein CpxP/Spy
MKKILLAAFCLTSFSLLTYAQTSGDKEKKTKQEKIDQTEKNMDSTRKAALREKGITEENLKDLDLSNEQQAQIQKMHKDMKQEKDKVKNDASLTEDQKNEKLRAVDKSYKSKVEAILTPEQKKKIKNTKKNKEKSDNP